MTTQPQQSCAFDQTSGIRKALDLVADKWTALIIMALAQDTKRYSELQRKIGGISQKMLTQTLRQLETSGLIHRKVYPVVPPMVEYSLTPLGVTLVEPLKALCFWAAEHFHEVEVAKEQASREKTSPDEAA
jgi:DNA-binding HxlR family transcriptional regulator